MKKTSNTQSKNHYSGIMKDFQQLGSSFKNEKYSIKEKSVYTAEQNKMYWIKMASAIMTTDTKPKVAYEEVLIGDELIIIQSSYCYGIQAKPSAL